MFLGSLISLMIAVALTSALALIYFDEISRWRFMGKLCSDDPAERATGINYMVQQIIGPDAEKPYPDDHPGRKKTIDAARNLLNKHDASHVCFQTIAATLEKLNLWGADFPRARLKSLAHSLDKGNPYQRRSVAETFGEHAWLKKTGHELPLVADTIGKLLKDSDPIVRRKAVIAVGALSDSDRLNLLKSAAADSDPYVAESAYIMLAFLLKPDATTPAPHPDLKSNKAIQRAIAFVNTNKSKPGTYPFPRHTSPPLDADDAVKRVAALQAKTTASLKGIKLNPEMWPLERLEAVRVYSDSRIEQLRPVLADPIAPMRDLAAIVAVERFGKPAALNLAKQLAASFTDNDRKSAAVLAGFLKADPVLLELITQRANTVPQNMHNFSPIEVPFPRYLLGKELGESARDLHRLALWCQGKPPKDFSPSDILTYDHLPKLSVITILLQGGDLSGTDFFLSTLQDKSPAELFRADYRILFNQFHVHRILKRFFPTMPDFYPWNPRNHQSFAVRAIRLWYLVNRHNLKFDPKTITFR